MSLGWLDLQQYLEANRAGEEERASAAQAASDLEYEAAVAQGANQGNFEPLTKFFARRRIGEQAKTSGDAFLSQVRPSDEGRYNADVEGMRLARGKRLEADAAYWKAQEERNARLKAEEDRLRDDAKKTFDAAKARFDYFHGKTPGFGARSVAYEKSYAEMNATPTKRGHYKIRRISDEERDLDEKARMGTLPEAPTPYVPEAPKPKGTT